LIRRDLKIGFKASLDFYEMEVEQICEILSRIGYKGVEWDIPHFDPRVTTPEQRRKLSEVPGQYGMEASEVMIQDDYITWDEVERNKRIDHTIECVRAAAEAGIGMVNVFTGPRFWDEGNPRLHRDIQEGDAWDMVLGAFEKIVPVAEECRVILALEICNGMVCRDFYTCNHLLDHIHSDYLCINMDPSHHHLARNDIPWVIKQWGPKITHVHLKDAVGNPGFQDETFVYPLPGDGVIDWNAVFDALEEVEYGGYYTVEYEAFHYYRKILKEDPVKAAEVSYRQIMALLEND
jgi:sugar phosphate isomerase/epimerase